MRSPLVLLLLCLTSPLFAGDIRERLDLPYAPGQTEAEFRLRKLNLVLPDAEKAPLVIWFHGGSLTGGSKDDELSRTVARRWAENGIAIADANYRLAPDAHFPTYIEDAARAVAWAVRNAPIYGLDAKRIFIGGYSAGGYLALMLALDPHYLRDAGVPPEAIAGVIGFSGQASTHFTARSERGLPQNAIVVDDAAPMGHLRADAPPLLLITGDNDWPARAEENRYLAAVMTKVVKHPYVSYLQVPNRTHGTLFSQLLLADDPAGQAILAFIANPRPTPPPPAPTKP